MSSGYDWLSQIGWGYHLAFKEASILKGQFASLTHFCHWHQAGKEAKIFWSLGMGLYGKFLFIGQNPSLNRKGFEEGHSCGLMHCHIISNRCRLNKWQIIALVSPQSLGGIWMLRRATSFTKPTPAPRWPVTDIHAQVMCLETQWLTLLSYPTSSGHTSETSCPPQWLVRAELWSQDNL